MGKTEIWGGDFACTVARPIMRSLCQWGHFCGPMQIDGVICAITEVSCMWMGHLCSLEVLYI